MAQRLYGRSGGLSTIVRFPVANTSAIAEGDILAWDGAGRPYVTPAAAAEANPIGVALETVPKPDSDGDAYVMVETCEDARFEYPIHGDGTIASTLIGKTCDISGAQQVAVHLGTQNVVRIDGIDTERQTVICRIKFNDRYISVT